MTTTNTNNSVASLCNVSVKFKLSGGGSTLAMNNVSIELKEGELLVFVGKSGSGKTTALNVLAGLVEATDGTATVLGKLPTDAREQMGYMFARDALMPWRSAKKNVEFGLELKGLPPAERESRAKHYLNMVHLGELAENYPSQLSQGQRQRVALARTWAPEPKIMLMDEPFAALDAQTRESVQEEFLRIWAKDRRSMVFVTHDINEAICLADRIIVFSSGAIIEEIPIPFERPRDLIELSAEAHFREIFKNIRAILSH